MDLYFQLDTTFKNKYYNRMWIFIIKYIAQILFHRTTCLLSETVLNLMPLGNEERNRITSKGPFTTRIARFLYTNPTISKTKNSNCQKKRKMVCVIDLQCISVCFLFISYSLAYISYSFQEICLKRAHMSNSSFSATKCQTVKPFRFYSVYFDPFFLGNLGKEICCLFLFFFLRMILFR